MSVVSGIMQSQATKDAAETAAQGARDAADVQWRMFEETQKNMAPWLESGKNALADLDALRSGQLDWKTIDPGYAIRLKEGVNALTAAGAAAGNLGSGGFASALDDYGQNLASQEYQNVYNRLAGISGTGQVQSNALGTLGMNTAGNMGNFLTNAANNIAQGQVASSNALYGGIRDTEKGIAAYYMFGRGGGGNGLKLAPANSAGSGALSTFG